MKAVQGKHCEWGPALDVVLVNLARRVDEMERVGEIERVGEGRPDTSTQ